MTSDPALANAGENRVEEILVVGQRENRESRGALVLPMSLFETPQAVSVVDAGFIEDFGLDDVNQLLNLVTGVNVEQVETDRTYYNSRGFDIKSMQVDGIGLPFNWNVVGALDTYVYDKVEVIRGANGLLTGIGNPSGTINYIRKRPTNDTFFKTEVTAGSWDKHASRRICRVRSRRAARGRVVCSARRNRAIRISTTTKTNARSSPAFSKVRSATAPP